MVVETKPLYIILEEEKGYNIDHIYLDEASAELALLTYFTPTNVQSGKVRVEQIEGKTLEHCCEM